MAKQVSRKKQLKNQLRRLQKKATTSGAVTVKEGAQEVVLEVASEVASTVEKQVATLEEFTADLEGVASDRAKTFYEAGIQSLADFEKWTEKELLALKGIGPATLKKLKELGLHFAG